MPATSVSKMKLFFSTITLKQNHINILVPVSAILILITCKCKFKFYLKCYLFDMYNIFAVDGCRMFIIHLHS